MNKFEIANRRMAALRRRIAEGSVSDREIRRVLAAVARLRRQWMETAKGEVIS